MKKIFSILIIFILIAGCKKYPDDKKLPHFRTPEGRLMHGGWNYMDVYNTITNIGYSTGNGQIMFNNKKEFVGHVQYLNFIGIWELTNKKKNLAITDDKGNTIEYVIQQLDYDKLRFRNDSLEFSFKPHK